MCRRAPAFVVAVTAVVVTVSAQTRPAPQFRTGVTLVELEVSVVDPRGLPFAGLTKADFSVVEDGSSREVVSAIEIGSSRNLAPVAKAPQSLAAEPADPRLVTIILDDAQIAADPRISHQVKMIARTIIESLDTSDQAAVLFTRSTRQSADFTTARSELINAIDAFVPAHSGPSSGRGVALGPMTIHELRTALNLLESVTRHLGTMSGRRKAIFYISTGVPLPPQSRPAFAEVTQSMRRVFNAAQRGNVMIYGIDPGGLASGPGTQIAESSAFGSGAVTGLSSRHEFLMMLAHNTGGRSIVDRNNPERAVTQLLSEHSHYYQVAYESSLTDTERSRKIEVNINRRGASARFRSMNTSWRP